MLRDYQIRAVRLAREHAGNRPILRLDTGAGKTTIAAEIIRLGCDRGRRSLFVVHRRELVEQARARIASFGLDVGTIIAGHSEARTKPVQVASIQTLINRDHWPADVVIVDECAHAVSASWRAVLDRYQGAAIIGLTATPCRLDGRGLGSVFGCILEPVAMRELIDRGYLVEPTVFAPPVDLSSLSTRGGDYASDQAAQRMGELTGSITTTWQQRAPGAKTVVFAVNVDHSERIVEAFRSIGVRAAHVDFATPTKQRAAILADLRTGALDVVSQVQLLSEGWDLPSLQCAILARPTKSLALFRQMVGRVMRPPGPVVVLDHAGNHHEHGPVTVPIEWSLDDRVRAKAAPSVRTCKACFAVNPPTAETCIVCGAPLGRVQDPASPPPVHAPGELVEFRPVKATRDEKREHYRQLVVTASQRGYRIGWARMRYKEKFHAWPRFGEDERELYECPEHEWQEAQYGYRRVQKCARCSVERVLA